MGWSPGNTRKNSEFSFVRNRTYTTFRLLVRVLCHWAIGESSVVTRGYTEKIRVLLCRSRADDLLITSSEGLPLSYRRLFNGDSGILGKTPSAPLWGIEPTIFRLLVRMLCHWTIGESSVVTRGYSEKIRVHLCRSRADDLPITSSDALPLNYRRLVGATVGPRAILLWLSGMISMWILLTISMKCQSDRYWEWRLLSA